jgi:dephospho-CoA kinase
MKARPLIVGLVGLAGTGKSTVAGIILDKYEFEPIRLGEHIRELLATNGLVQTPENERSMQVSIRQQYGMAALIKLSVPQIEKSLASGNSVLIDSMCSFSERECLHQIADDCAIHVVAVHARKERRQFNLRNRHQRPLSSEQMEQRDLLELDQLEKGKLLALADHHLVNNDVPEMLESDVCSLMRLIAATRRSDRE